MSLRDVSSWDIRRIFEWMKSDDLRSAFRMAERPERLAHFEYWRKLKASSSERAWSIYVDELHMGTCGLKYIDEIAKKCELWIYIGDSKFRGQGIGRAALEAIFFSLSNKFQFESVYLHVSKYNLPAIHLYKETGFQESQEKASEEWKNAADIIRMERSL